SRQASGQTILVKIVGDLRGRGVGDARHDADGYTGFETLAFRFTLSPMLSHVLRDKKPTGAVRCLNLTAVVSDIVNSGFGIFSDPICRGKVGRIIEPRSGNRHGDHI